MSGTDPRINSLMSHKKPMKYPLSPHFTDKEIETDVKSNLPKVIQLESGESKTHVQGWLTLEPVVLITVRTRKSDSGYTTICLLRCGNPPSLTLDRNTDSR